MDRARRGTNRRPALVAAVLAIVALASPGWAQDAPGPATPAAPAATQGAERAGPEAEISFRTLRRTTEGDEVFEGAVTIAVGDSRIQADRIVRHQGRYLEAEGNVLVVWSGNRIFGTRMTYDLETESGTLYDAIGQVEADYLFWADEVDKIGEDLIKLRRATVTTCTQPTPYWSFSVSSATVRINGYARMWNVRLRGGVMPFIYLPYLVWPVKQDRALGLLLPEFQTTDSRGRAIEQKLFIPIGRSADLTLLGRYYTEAGFGWGGEARYVPNRNGAASFRGFFIDDKVDGRRRYSVSYNQTQEFLNGFRLVADVNVVSDFEYFSDFERDLSLVSSPTILTRVEMSRNGPWASMNVRELRREQLFSDGSSLVQQTLPEVEWRGRNRRLGKTPLYLSYETSFALIQQREKPVAGDPDVPLDADYFRGDVFPTVSLPWSPTPWIDITPQVNYRLTSYTQRLDTTTTGESVVDQGSLIRGLFGAGVQVVGPKISRIWNTENDGYSLGYKHSIEPQISYGYRDTFDDLDDIILYDEIDRFNGSGTTLDYALVQRLLAKRPRTSGAPPPAAVERIVLPDGSESVTEPASDPGDAPPPEPDAPVEPVEIATFEIRQSRSFDEDLTSADLDRDGVIDRSSPYSNVRVAARFNPNQYTSMDVQGTYHILYDALQDLSISTALRGRMATLRMSMVHRNGLGVFQSGSVTQPDGSVVPILSPNPDTTQMRLSTGLNLLDGRLQFLVDGTYDANPPSGQSHVPDTRWRVQYSTQCCTIWVERLSRDFSGLQDREDFYFRVDLKGLGKLLDFNY